MEALLGASSWFCPCRFVLIHGSNKSEMCVDRLREPQPVPNPTTLWSLRLQPGPEARKTR